MATVYSLVCWGGKDGKTVTMTIASPCVVSLTNHGLRDGTGVVFSTTGTLPTGVTAGATYYSRSTATGTFNLYDTSAHAIAGGSTGIVNTSGSQSGVHTAKGAYYLGLSDKSRWAADSVERIFDGLGAWLAARKSVALAADSEVCEIGEAFTDTVAAGSCDIGTDMACAAVEITTKVNGARSAAFHGGVVGGGYVAANLSQGYDTLIQITRKNVTLDGIEILVTALAMTGMSVGGAFNTVRNCIAKSALSQAYYLNGFVLTFTNNIGYDSDIAFNINGYNNYFNVFANNLAAGGSKGIYGTGYTGGVYYNNVAVGCTTPWSTATPGDNLSSAYFVEFKNNAGGAGRGAWFDVVNAGVAVTVTSASPAVVAYTGHGATTGDPVRFNATTIPTGITKFQMYYVRVIDADTFNIYDTYAHAIDTGNTTGVVNTTSAGSAVKCTIKGTSINTLTTDCFLDYANKDFRPNPSPATGTSLIDAGYDVFQGYAYDIKDNPRPSYNPDGAEAWDLGAFEYDQGHGLRPSTVNLSVTGMASGSEIAIYKASDMSQILAPQSTTGSYSGTYTYTGDTNIIVRVRKGTSATRYLPYEYAGTITSTGFQLVVSQIPDTIAQ